MKIKRFSSTAILAFLLFAFSGVAHAEEYRFTIFDATQNSGIANASISYLGDCICITNSRGRCKGKINGSGTLKLTVSATGYKTFSGDYELKQGDNQIGLQPTASPRSAFDTTTLIPASFPTAEEGFNARFIVTNVNTGEKLSNVSVWIQHRERDNPDAGSTGHDGIAEIFTNPGSHSITAKRSGYQDWRSGEHGGDVNVQEGINTRIQMTPRSKGSSRSTFIATYRTTSFPSPTVLSPQSRQTITIIVTANGSPLEGATVESVDGKGKRVCTKRKTNAKGMTKVEVSPETYAYVFVSKTGYPSSSTPTNRVNNGELRVNIDAQPHGRQI